MPTPAGLIFQAITLRASAMALVMARRALTTERRARFARVVRYCRARGLRGAEGSAVLRIQARSITLRFQAADRF